MLPRIHTSRSRGLRLILESRTTVVLFVISCVLASLFFIESSLSEEQQNGLSKALAASTHTSRSTKADVDVSLIEELYQTVTADHLSKIAKKYKKLYKHAEPFPHIAIDGIFPQRLLDAIVAEMPEHEIIDGCLRNADRCFESAKQNKKSSIKDESQMGMYTRILFGFLKSSTYVTFLQELTGIDMIIPDPHYRGSGIHFIGAGGNLDIHADFNKYEGYTLDRRVNSFLYLNPDWPTEYGGELELWSKDMKSCYQKIPPKYGRFVVFSSTDFSYHGHPEPMPAPEGRARRSMALYYYTNGRPTSECLQGDCTGKGHETLFQKPVGCQTCEEQACKRLDDSKPSFFNAVE
jgi:Rps23 Pro-64 3,4-dihydroxylase Tpa1-like proline 4-hydroxylase